MSTNHSFAKRILALLLTLMMFIGMVPLSVSAAKSESSSVNNDSPATLDEVKPKNGDGDDSSEEPEYPKVGFNERAVYYQKNRNSLLYVSGKEFSQFKLIMKPDEGTYEAIAADLANKNKEHFFVTLTKAENNESDSENNLKGYCSFKAEDGIVTVSLNMNKMTQFRENENKIVVEGFYTFSVMYAIEDSQTQIGKYDFRVVNKSSVVSDIKYNGGEYKNWFNKSVEISFKTNSEILTEVTVNGEIVTEVNGSYSYKFNESTNKPPVIKTTDLLNNTVSTELNQINIDTEAPTFGKLVFMDENENEVTGWYNKALKVEISVSDNASGVDSSSIKVTNKDGDNVNPEYNDGILSFTATKRCEYNIVCKDIAGNEAKKTIAAKQVQIDKTKPEAKDITLSFGSGADLKDGLFSFLSFGMCSNNDIAVKISAVDHGQAPISKISLFNKVGEEYKELEKVDDEYILKAPDEGKRKATYDLYVSAEDEAGNKSDLFKVADSDVKTTLKDGTQKQLKDLDGRLYEIVISKVSPLFDDEVRYHFSEDKITDVESDGKSITHVASNSEPAKIAFKAREEITGLAEVTVTLQRDGSGEQNVFHESYADADKKTETTDNAVIDLKGLESGVYTLTFTAKANNGNTSPEKTETFVVDNDAPALTEKGFDFFKKDDAELKADEWTNDDVKVSFELTDSTGIKSVEVKLGEEEITCNGDGSGKYSFTATKYGNYSVIVTDSLGNTKTLKTGIIHIDKAAPVVKDEKFSFSNADENGKQEWTNENVTVSFSALDLPEPEEEHRGLKELLVTFNGNPVTSHMDLETGECSFTAEKYGTYKVKLTDALGNSSLEEYEVGPIHIDKTAPTVKGVNFSVFEESEDTTVTKRPYGVYANTALKMTVTVENTTEEEDCSELTKDSVTVKDNDGSDVANIEFDSWGQDTNNPAKYNYVFKINLVEELTADYIKNLIITAADTAKNPNTSKVKLGGDGESTVLVTMDDAEAFDKALYDVIVTTTTATVDPIKYYKYKKEGDEKKEVEIEEGKRKDVSETRHVFQCLSSVTVKTEVKDELVGVQKAVFEFGKVDENLKEDELKTVPLSYRKAYNPTKTAKVTNVLIDEEFLNIIESGRYIFRITANNNAGNKYVYYEEVYSDNAKPFVEDIQISGTCSNANENGIYLSGEDAAITVKASDANGELLTAGVAEIELSCGKPSEITKNDDGSAERTFTLEPGQKYENITYTITDAFGQSISGKLVDHKLSIEGKGDVKPSTEKFEIVVNNDSDQIQSEGFTYDFDFEDEDNLIFKGVDNDKGKGDVSIELTNDFSGISSTVLKVNNQVIDEEELTVNKEEDSYGKTIKKILTLDTKGYDSGKYEIQLEVTDLSGDTKTFTETFYIDKTAPTVKSINFKTNENNFIEQFFNFISFGLYSKDDIAVEVTVEDSAPSAGIDGNQIQLSSENGLKVNEGGTTETTEETEDGLKRTYVKKFTFKSSDEKATCNYNDFAVSVTDKFDNSEGHNPESYQIEGKDFEFDPDKFEIVTSGNAPVVSGFTGSGDGKYIRKSDKGEWFKSNPVITFNVKDETSKLHSVEVKLNGQDVTGICTYDNGKSLSDDLPFTDFDSHSGTKIENVVVSLDTSSLDLNDDGVENVLTVTATGNNGVTSDPASYSFFMDRSAPVISEITSSGSGKYTRSDNTVWFAGNPTLKFNVTDEESMIYAIEVKLNGVNVTDKCTYDNGKSLPDSFSSDISYAEITLDTTAIDLKADGKKNVLTVTATSNTSVTSKPVSYSFYMDKQAPVVKDNTFTYSNASDDGKQQWTSGSVTVTFNVIDLPTSNNSGVAQFLEVECDRHENAVEDISIDIKTGVCSFTATEYGVYTITVKDNVGNTDSYPTATVLIDHEAPTLTEVRFAMAQQSSEKTLSVKPYGAYSNTVIQMTAVVENTTHEAQCAPLDENSVEVLNQNNPDDDSIVFVEKVDGKNKYIFNISVNPKESLSAEDIMNLLFTVKDTVENEAEFVLGSDHVPVSVDKEGMPAEIIEFFEVIATSVGTSQIADFGVGKLAEKEVTYHNKNVVYNGTIGEFTTEIKDDLIGIDAIKVEFGRIDLNYSGDLDTVDNLTDVTSKAKFRLDKEGDFKSLKYFNSSKEKITDVEISYEGNTKDSGRYVLRVTATNNAGNPVIKSDDFYVDNTIPSVDAYKVDGIIKSYSKHGVYLNYNEKNKPVLYVTVTDYSASVPSAGIKDVQVQAKPWKEENGELKEQDPVYLSENNSIKPDQSTDQKYPQQFIAEFKLESDTKYTDFVITVTDEFGQKHTEKLVDKGKLTVGSRGDITPDKVNFEVIATNQNHFMFGKFGYDEFDHYDTIKDTEIYIVKDNENGNGKITVNVSNVFSGVKKVEFKIDGGSVGYFSVARDTTDSFEKVTEKSVGVDAKGLDSGEHTVEISVTDYCGVLSKVSETFYIDKTKPVITEVKFEKGEKSILEQFLHFVTFGLYSNDNIKVSATAKDPGPSSGISANGITLNANGRAITPDGYTGNNVASTEEQEYTWTFSLSTSDSKDDAYYGNFFGDWLFTVTDNFDNKKDGIETDTEEGKTQTTVLISDDVHESIEIEKEFEIVAYKNGADISDINFEANPGDSSYERDGIKWFSDSPVAKFDVTDDVSKIHSIQVSLNGDSVNEKCTYNSIDEIPSQFTDFDLHEGVSVNIANVALNTAKDGITLNVNSVDNKVAVNVVSNNGVSVNKEGLFRVDREKPYITKFSFSEGGSEENPTTIEKTTYGYYFKVETTVTVTASDVSRTTGSEGVGVSKIGFRTKDIDGTEKEWISDATADKADFTVAANFKGQIFAFAIDYLNNNINKEEVYTPENVIVETEAMHKDATTIQFSHPTATHKDANNLDLYDNSVNVDVEIGSTYAGIKDIEISVKAPYDTGNNYTVTSSVDNNGVISDTGMTGSGSVGSWGIISTDANLVTRVKRTITVANNSNDIEITAKVTDRAGYTSESGKDDKFKILKFSIDKTNPVLDVSFDESDGNPIGDRRYFNKAKTATVTVKERNFNSKDYTETVKRQLLNSNYTAPSIGAWSVTPNTSNPDNTVNTATITFNDDGDYSFSCSCIDLVGRKSETKTIKDFTVDKTKPVIDDISLTFDSGDKGSGIYHSTKATAVITIHDVNFYDNASYVKADISALKQDHNGAASSTAYSETGWSVSGDKITKTINFNEDGDYSIKVTCTDKARNEQQAPKEQSTFIIDQKYERCEIKNVDNKQAYKEKVEPVIEAFDYNYDNVVYHLYRYGETDSDEQDGNKQTAGWVDVTDEMTHNVDEKKASGNLNVSFSNFESITDNDGIYKIEATGTDKAKNTKKDEKLFSVSRFGANFMLDEETEKLTSVIKYTNNVENPVVIKEVNVVDLKESVVQINRESSTATLKEGEDYRVHKTHKDNEWYEFTFEIEPEQFMEEGRYEITITSKDALDRTVSNRTIKNGTDKDKNVIERDCPCSFVVDKTLPIVTIAGIEQDQYYSEAEREVVVTCEDANLDSESLKVEFDGKLLTDNDYQKTEEANMIELRLKLEADGNTDDRSFKVSITDKAGNENKDGEIAPFRLSATWLARLLHDHLPLVIILGSLLLLAIAFVVFMIVRKNNKKKND